MELHNIPEEQYLLCLDVVRRVWRYFYDKESQEIRKKQKTLNKSKK